MEPASDEMTKQFSDKLESFSQSLSPDERRILAVILAVAAAHSQEVIGYGEVDPTALDIGETAAQVYYQYVDERKRRG